MQTQTLGTMLRLPPCSAFKITKWKNLTLCESVFCHHLNFFTVYKLVWAIREPQLLWQVSVNYELILVCTSGILYQDANRHGRVVYGVGLWIPGAVCFQKNLDDSPTRCPRDVYLCTGSVTLLQVLSCPPVGQVVLSQSTPSGACSVLDQWLIFQSKQDLCFWSWYVYWIRSRLPSSSTLAPSGCLVFMALSNSSIMHISALYWLLQSIHSLIDTFRSTAAC